MKLTLLRQLRVDAGGGRARGGVRLRGRRDLRRRALRRDGRAFCVWFRRRGFRGRRGLDWRRRWGGRGRRRRRRGSIRFRIRGRRGQLVQTRVDRLQTRGEPVDDTLQIERERLDALAQLAEFSGARDRLNQRPLHLVQRGPRPVERLVLLIDHTVSEVVGARREGDQRESEKGEQTDRRYTQGAGFRMGTNQREVSHGARAGRWRGLSTKI